MQGENQENFIMNENAIEIIMKDRRLFSKYLWISEGGVYAILDADEYSSLADKKTYFQAIIEIVNALY